MRNKVAKKLKQQMKPILSVKNFEETTQYVIQRKAFQYLIRDLTRKRNGQFSLYLGNTFTTIH